jgi:hypothetical protein
VVHTAVGFLVAAAADHLDQSSSLLAYDNAKKSVGAAIGAGAVEEADEDELHDRSGQEDLGALEIV